MSSPLPAAEVMAQMLGLRLFSSDLFLPDYRDDTQGAWRVIHSGMVPDRGYWGDRYLSHHMPALLRRDDERQWETWMSLAPFELESQEVAVRHATGHTVIMGLGMGWAAVNAALNPRCERLTVVERDPDVLNLFERGEILEQLPGEAAEKIRIERADALEWRPSRPVDLLYPDIWLHIAEPATLPDALRMQANVEAEKIYVWGQELIAERLAREASGGHEVDATALRAAAERIDLPLLWPEGDYTERALTAARVYRQRFEHPGEPA